MIGTICVLALCVALPIVQRVSYKQGVQAGLLRASNEVIHQAAAGNKYALDDPRREAVLGAAVSTSCAIDRLEGAVRDHGVKMLSGEPRYHRHYIAEDSR